MRTDRHEPTGRGGRDAPSIWHHLTAQAALEALASTRQGLTDEEAKSRLERHGPNLLPTQKRRGPLLRFLLQFHNVLIYVLLASAVVTAWLGEWVDAGVILGVVLINAVIGFLQEGKAERALDAIRNMLSLNAQVLRAGRRRE
ncbi:MAG TPA: cation-transporting P-type ATPase, partial [Burkholderiales bacterium]|nr:cation-transporting P-type ATPase [Burkholderiales bacterium]